MGTVLRWFVILLWLLGCSSAWAADGGSDAGSALGEACSSAETCGSGFCVDGVCCDSACPGQCETCRGTPRGQCQPVPNGEMRAGQACAGIREYCQGACDGAKRDACVYPAGPTERCSGATSCVKGRATGNACQLGSCVRATTECGLFLCGNDGCLTACDSAADCVPGAECASGSCRPASGPKCLDEHTTLAPNGVASRCEPYPCDSDAGACATSCSVDSDCVGEQARCRSGRCVAAADIRRVGLYDPEACSCRSVGAGAPRSVALACLLLVGLALARRRQRRATPPAVSGLVVLAALLACGDPQDELPASEVCDDVGYSIANRTEACSDDRDLASERWAHYDERFACNVGQVTEEIRELYVCPVELLRMDCETFLAYGDDLDALLSSVPECTRVVKRKDGSLLLPSDLDAGADAAAAEHTLDGGAQ